jgi:hypothetical protein
MCWPLYQKDFHEPMTLLRMRKAKQSVKLSSIDILETFASARLALLLQCTPLRLEDHQTQKPILPDLMILSIALTDMPFAMLCLAWESGSPCRSVGCRSPSVWYICTIEYPADLTFCSCRRSGSFCHTPDSLWNAELNRSGRHCSKPGKNIRGHTSR